MAPDLSPDNGTTSTNSTSPALSSTLSESSSLMDVGIMQQQQQQQTQQPTNVASLGQQIQVVRTNQQSPGRTSMPDHILETNAFDNKIESSSPSANNNNLNNNNLLIVANEHKEFSCSIGDENISSPVSSNNNNLVSDKNSESDETQKSLDTNSRELKQLNIESSKNDAQKNANISVASNIASAFINLSSLSSSSKNIANSTTSGLNPTTKSVNVIVTQQPTQHFMKALSFTTSRGIFVPNVIATNITPQFTVHQYGLHGSSSGPAPNVTVNPNGNFNSNSNATIRPGISNHFRLLLQQQPSNINVNIINPNNQPIPSPILEASLQTITKEANLQAAKVLPTKTIFPTQVIAQRPITPFASVQQQSITTQQQQKSDHHHISEANQSEEASAINTDQHIRVLTPSEIMKTLPSLSTHDNICFNSSCMPTNIEKQSSETDNNKSQKLPNSSNNPETSGSVTIISNNSAISSPMTITTTITTSECNTFNSSHFTTTTTTTKATAMSSTSNNAQIIMVRGYKTYKNIFFLYFFRFLNFFRCFDFFFLLILLIRGRD